MDIDIGEREKMNLVGLTRTISLEDDDESIEDQVGNLWERLADFCRESWGSIEPHVVNPELSYEVHIWNEDELEEKGELNVFVGMEVNSLDDIPLELVGKVLPAGGYAVGTVRGEDIKHWETDILHEWLPESDYMMSMFNGKLFHAQCYHEEKFKGVDNLEESELQVFIPVVKQPDELEEE